MNSIAIRACGLIIVSFISWHIYDAYKVKKAVNKDLKIYDETKQMNWEECQRHVKTKYPEDSTEILMKLNFLRMGN